jgi:DNA polymerase III subunit delta'
MTSIIGHNAAVDAFLAAMRGPRPPHAWLFTGDQGLGKASLAKQLAARLLAEAADQAFPRTPRPIDEEHPTARLITARSHPDYHLIEREVWEKSQPPRLVPYDLRKDDDKPSRSIRVIQIRWLQQKLALAPSLSGRRVVLIDAADEFEVETANALLKSLEEPAQGTIFILISHSPGRLLPTIRSRCRVLRFSALSDAEMRSAIRSSLPDANEAELSALIELGQGSPGRAIKLSGVDAAGMLSALQSAMESGDKDNRGRLALAASMTAKAAQPRFEAFLGLVPAFLASEAKKAEGTRLAAVLKAWEACRDLASHAIPGSLDPQSVTLTLTGHVAALAPSQRGAKA